MTVVTFHGETVAGAVVLGTCESSTSIALERVLGCRECLVPLPGAGGDGDLTCRRCTLFVVLYHQG